MLNPSSINIMNKVIELGIESYPIISTRKAVRAIIMEGQNILMVKSSLYGDLKFPGGGKLPKERHFETLIREVEEESGYQVLLDSLTYYVSTVEYRNSLVQENKGAKMISYYYLVKVKKETVPLRLDPYESLYGYYPIWIDIHQAIKENESVLHRSTQEELEKIPWIQREIVVLNHIKRNLIDKN
jgi:8-oxo-dGTP pyrophosphatase MutT (NUDIX family)